MWPGLGWQVFAQVGANIDSLIWKGEKKKKSLRDGQEGLFTQMYPGGRRPSETLLTENLSYLS